MSKYLVIFVICIVLSRNNKLRVLASGLLFCVGTSYYINEHTDSLQLVLMTSHFSVIFVSLLMLAIYEKTTLILIIYGGSLILTLISYTAWQYPLLLQPNISLLILRYGAVLGLELGLMLLIAKESFSSFRGFMLLTMVSILYFIVYL